MANEEAEDSAKPKIDFTPTSGNEDEMSPRDREDMAFKLGLLSSAVEKASKKIDEDKALRVEDNRRRAQKVEELDKRATRDRWILAAMSVITVISLVVGWNARATGQDIKSARSESTQEVCDVVNQLLNVFAASNAPHTQEERDDLLRRTRQFEHDLEDRTKALGCTFHINDPGPVVTTTTIQLQEG